MAKNKSSFENMASGLVFEHKNTNKQTNKIEYAPPIKTKKVGRPRDADLAPEESTIPTTIQLTEDTLYLVDKYCLENKIKSRSQVIRELIKNNLNV